MDAFENKKNFYECEEGYLDFLGLQNTRFGQWFDTSILGKSEADIAKDANLNERGMRNLTQRTIDNYGSNSKEFSELKTSVLSTYGDKSQEWNIFTNTYRSIDQSGLKGLAPLSTTRDISLVPDKYNFGITDLGVRTNSSDVQSGLLAQLNNLISGSTDKALAQLVPSVGGAAGTKQTSAGVVKDKTGCSTSATDVSTASTPNPAKTEKKDNTLYYILGGVTIIIGGVLAYAYMHPPKK